MTSPIDDLLARARLVYPPHTPAETDAARTRLVARLARTSGSASPAVPEETVGSAPDAVDGPASGGGEAARNLRTLCEAVVTRTALHSLLDFFAHTVMPRPVGARVLGCLLQLADSEESARFWWQYAAGAEDAPAAFCLYLHHLALGERGEADWWYTQGVSIQTRPRPVDACAGCRTCGRTGRGPLGAAGATGVTDAAGATGVANVTGAAGVVGAAGAPGAECRGTPPLVQPLVQPLTPPEPAAALHTDDTSLPTTLRVLRALKTRSGSAPVPVVATAIMDYVPAALGFVDDDLDLPLPAPDFAEHIRTLTAPASQPALPRTGPPPLPARTVRRCTRRRYVSRRPPDD